MNDAELEPHWLPFYAHSRSLTENVFSLARPLWGKAQAEWAWQLAQDLVEELPAADGAEGTEWVGAILWVAALDVGMDRDDRLWSHVVADITTMTSLPEDVVQSGFEQLRGMGLTRPRHEPPWWRQDAENESS